jgi:hypothetical protein
MLMIQIVREMKAAEIVEEMAAMVEENNLTLRLSK